jgi:hypothetical protein
MADLFELLIFLGVVFLSLLASGKKKKKPGAQAQPQATGRAQARPTARTSRPLPQAAAQRTAADAPSRQAGVEDLLDILRGRLPMPEPAARATPQAVPEDIDDEAVSLEDVDFDRATAHETFHDKYVEEPSPIVTSRRESRHKYRLTPRTAREAVVWTAIFTRPKGLE